MSSVSREDHDAMVDDLLQNIASLRAEIVALRYAIDHWDLADAPAKVVEWVLDQARFGRCVNPGDETK